MRKETELKSQLYHKLFFGSQTIPDRGNCFPNLIAKQSFWLLGLWAFMHHVRFLAIQPILSVCEAISAATQQNYTTQVTH